MIRVFAAALAASTIAGAAFAADLPSRRAPQPAAFAPPPVFTWSGFYLGVNGGGWFNNSSINYGITSGKLGGGGGLIGGTVGYNWQTASRFVIGVEGDLDYRSKTNVTPPAALNVSSSDGYLGTARVRLGYGMDRALLYVTGGLAVGNTVSPDAIRSPFLGFNGVRSSNTSSVGWSAGGGVEFAVTNNWSVKGEYIYADLGRKSLTYGNFLQVGTPVVTTGEHTARVGLNYRFNMGGGAGYAKY